MEQRIQLRDTCFRFLEETITLQIILHLLGNASSIV